MALDAALDALACHRLARLIAQDLITVEPRSRFIRGEYARRGDTAAIEARRAGIPAHHYDWTDRALIDGPDAPKLAQLIVCRWCVSVWCAFGVVILRRAFPRAWSPVARALAFSSAAGLLGSLEPKG